MSSPPQPEDERKGRPPVSGGGNGQRRPKEATPDDADSDPTAEEPVAQRAADDAATPTTRSENDVGAPDQSGDDGFGSSEGLREGELYSLEEELFGEGEEIEGSPIARIWRLFPRIFPYFRPHSRKGVGTVVTTALLAVLALAEPWPLAFVVDVVLGDKPVPGWISGLVGETTGSLILFGAMATIALTLLTGLTVMVNQYLTVQIQEQMSLDFRGDLFEHIQRLSLSFHEDTRTGMMMFRLSSQAKAIGQLVVGLPKVGQSVLTLLGMLFIAYRINAQLALVAIAIVPFIYISINYYMKMVEPQLMRVRGMEGTSFAIVHESLQMLHVIRAFGRERHEWTRFRDQGERTVDARVGLTIRQTLFRLGVNFIIACGTAAVIGVGAYQVLAGRISVGELLVVLAYITAVYQPLEQLTGTAASFQQLSISVDHAIRIMDIDPDVQERPDAIDVERVEGSITFESVGFDYAAHPGALSDVSFEARPGESLAVVGPTGAGKSTLASLLPRFVDATTGKVRVDGVDVRDYRLDDLRDQFSIVLQEPLLFAGSIRDNIRYGKLDAERAEIVDAAKAANAHEFIVGLPERYGTQLGERGAKVSGGERQRIALARAFLRDAPILVLDEPTSSIDSQTEEGILDALDRLMEGRTTIVIAHRLSTLRNVDRVLVLDHGRAVQCGTHDELIEQEGLYRSLWATQAGQLGAAKSALSGAASVPGTAYPAAAPEGAGNGAHSRAATGPEDPEDHQKRKREQQQQRKREQQQQQERQRRKQEQTQEPRQEHDRSAPTGTKGADAGTTSGLQRRDHDGGSQEGDAGKPEVPVPADRSAPPRPSKPGSPSGVPTGSESDANDRLDVEHIRHGTDDILIAGLPLTDLGIDGVEHVIVLRNGEVVEHGRHEALMRAGGPYQGFWTTKLTQFIESRPPSGDAQRKGGRPATEEPNDEATTEPGVQSILAAPEGPRPAATDRPSMPLKRVAFHGNSILIAARHADAREVDDIIHAVVVRDGRLVKYGTHQQLMAVSGVYQSFWREQHTRHILLERRKRAAAADGVDDDRQAVADAVAEVAATGAVAAPDRARLPDDLDLVPQSRATAQARP